MTVIYRRGNEYHIVNGSSVAVARKISSGRYRVHGVGFTGGSGGSDGGSGGDSGSGGSGLIMPFPKSSVTSWYGWREHPVYGGQRFHEAIDFGQPFGTPVKAAGAGTVKHVRWWSTWGNSVSIDHGGGIGTNYNHLDGFNVTEGQTVKQGDIIGYVGNTGVGTGPHLDFHVTHEGKTNDIGYNRMNPEDYARWP